jgi:hypothetical protein
MPASGRRACAQYSRAATQGKDRSYHRERTIPRYSPRPLAEAGRTGSRRGRGAVGQQAFSQD